VKPLRILVVAERIPRLDESSGDRRFALLFRFLARRHHVDLWVERQLDPAAKLPGISLVEPGWDALTRLLAGPRYDVAFFEFYFAAERYGAVVRAGQPEARVVVDTVDVHFARLAAGATLGLHTTRQVAVMRRRELRQYRAADLVLVVSPEDADVLACAEPGIRTCLVPNVAVVTERAGGSRDLSVLFVGHFDHAPNRDGLEWFVASCWPAIHRARSDARLVVIGSRLPAGIAKLGARPGVEIVGRVPDLEPWLDRATVAIAPLRYGAGMKGKVIDAMAAGVPVVATPIGTQGLGAVHGEHLIVAATAESFAAGVLGLLESPAECERLGLAGQAHVRRTCDAPVVADILQRCLVDLVAAPRTATDRSLPRPAAALLRARIGHQIRRLRRRLGASLRPPPLADST
jgi:glycosyltransferase involved in cell wall biosynthesis